MHLSYCMKNCNGDAADLQHSILNIVKHYQVTIVPYCVLGTEIYISMYIVHAMRILQGMPTDCPGESPCRKPGYSPSEVQHSDPLATDVYTKALQWCNIYHQAHFCCHVSNAWVFVLCEYTLYECMFVCFRTVTLCACCLVCYSIMILTEWSLSIICYSPTFRSVCILVLKRLR